jgi:hypothetical protein
LLNFSPKYLIAISIATIVAPATPTVLIARQDSRRLVFVKDDVLHMKAIYRKARVRSWTYREVKELMRLANIGFKSDSIAQILNRSSHSVRQKAFWLRVSLADETNLADKELEESESGRRE